MEPNTRFFEHCPKTKQSFGNHDYTGRCKNSMTLPFQMRQQHPIEDVPNTIRQA
jgi:hypothetical protein